MSLSQSNETPETKWPGVMFAYDYVLPSYQWILTRLEAADTRIQVLMAFAVTLTITVVSVGLSGERSIDLYSVYFLLALLFFGGLIGFGLFTRVWGVVKLIDPNKLYEKWLYKSEWEFKKDMICFAGQDFDCNIKLIKRKSDAFLIMLLLFLMEATLLCMWII